jgi:2-oxoglutarate ferredoxin oxidoreductase subunit alpha
MPQSKKISNTIDTAILKIAGDSGDGMQLTGNQFSNTTALVGNDLRTLPDFPAEIRAPVGTLFGVSGFQIQFGNKEINTPGDNPDMLVAMNPAALKTNLKNLKPNSVIILNEDTFTRRYLKMAKFDSNPLENGILDEYQVYSVPITTLNRRALEELDLSVKIVDRCKNFFALGILYWMYTRPLDQTHNWIKEKFKSSPEIIEANARSLTAGYNYALSTELFTTNYKISNARVEPGTYKNINGNEALCLGMVAASHKAGLNIFLSGYPITPASHVLQRMSQFKAYGVKTFQAEDEIAGICAAIGASFTGSLGATVTSGPGLTLKSESIGLAVMTELPLLICDIQRGGPSTGLPTKTEQSDLFLSLFGRHGEAPLPVIAAKDPADCFNAAYEAIGIALKFMTPVILLSDSYLANGSEPWKIPEVSKLPNLEINVENDPEKFAPYLRHPDTLSRMWAIPGTPGLEHRIGGLEKEDITGNVSYDPDNHDKMVKLRAEKIERVKNFVSDPEIEGQDKGELLILSWGSTYGIVRNALQNYKGYEKRISHYHLRWLNPLPKNLKKFIRNFKHVLIPELNMGQLSKIIRAEYLVDAKGLNILRGIPFQSKDLITAINKILGGKDDA